MNHKSLLSISSLVLAMSLSASLRAESLIASPTRDQNRIEVKWLRSDGTVAPFPTELVKTLELRVCINSKSKPIQFVKNGNTFFATLPNGTQSVFAICRQSFKTSGSHPKSILHKAIAILPRPYGGFPGTNTGSGVELLQKESAGTMKIIALKDGQPLKNVDVSVTLCNAVTEQFNISDSGFIGEFDAPGPYLIKLSDESMSKSDGKVAKVTLSGTFNPPPYLNEFYILKQDLLSEYKRQDQEYVKEQKTAKTEAEKEAVEFKIRRLDRTLYARYAPKMLDVLRPHAKDDGCISALAWTASIINGDYNEAIELLRKHHLFHQKLLDRQRFYQVSPRSWSEPLLLEQLSSPLLPASLKPQLLFYLAYAKLSDSRWPYHLSYMEAESVEEWTEIIGPATMSRVSKLESAALMKEAVAIFESLKKEYPSVVMPGSDRTIAQLVDAELFEMTSLNVGVVAPDISGEDLDGKPMKLSDFRGKITVISFWATWCRPCMQLIPEEINLVRTFANRPFTFVGVNGDDDRMLAKQVCKDKGIPWRSFWSDKGARGPIPRAWNVSGWPTIYVLDEHGVIRAKGLTGNRLRLLLEKLISEVETKGNSAKN